MSYIATAAAVVGGASSLAGSVNDYKSSKKQQKQLEKNREEDMGLILKYGQRSVDSLTPGYQNAQDISQSTLNRNLGLTGQTFQPRVETLQSGDYMAQQAIMAGLQGQRNAILGDPINYGALSAQNVPVDYSSLTGLTNPAPVEYAKFQMPEYGSSTNTAAQESWTDSSAHQYLAANPDIEANYISNRLALLRGGDPQFTTVEGYAKWHWDNYGKQEERPLTTSSKRQGASFSANHVRDALNSGSVG